MSRVEPARGSEGSAGDQAAFREVQAKLGQAFFTEKTKYAPSELFGPLLHAPRVALKVIELGSALRNLGVSGAGGEASLSDDFASSSRSSCSHGCTTRRSRGDTRSRTGARWSTTSRGRCSPACAPRRSRRSATATTGSCSPRSASKGAPCLLAPCSACFLVLTKTQHYVAQHGDLARRVHAGLEGADLEYRGVVQVRHPLDVFVNDIGVRRIAKAVKRRLSGLKVACYYGCQVVRPFATFDSAHDPTTMDRLVEALGAKPVRWPLKTRCCGGALTGTIPDVGLRLSEILLRDAARRGAEMIVTVCPLCQFNLECYQREIGRTFQDTTPLPVLYLTQLMGKAFGLYDADLGMRRLFVSPDAAFARHEGEPAHA